MSKMKGNERLKVMYIFFIIVFTLTNYYIYFMRRIFSDVFTALSIMCLFLLIDTLVRFEGLENE